MKKRASRAKYPGISKSWPCRAMDTISHTSATKRALSKLNLVDLRTHQELTPPRFHTPGIIDSLSFDTRATVWRSALRPRISRSDAYVLDVAGNHFEAWTRSEAGAVDLAKFVIPRLTEFPTFDRTDGKAASRSRCTCTSLRRRHASGVDRRCTAGRSRSSDPASIPGCSTWSMSWASPWSPPMCAAPPATAENYLALDNGMLREDAVKDIGALLRLDRSAEARSTPSMWWLPAARTAAIWRSPRWSITATDCAAASMPPASPTS